MPLKRRCGTSQKTQPLQRVRFREKGAECLNLSRVVVHLSLFIWCKVRNTWHEVITTLITKFHVLAALRCCQHDVKPFPYPRAWCFVGRESPSFHQPRGDGMSTRRCLAGGRVGHFLELLVLASPGFGGWTAHRAELCTLQGVCAVPALGVIVLLAMACRCIWVRKYTSTSSGILLVWCDLPLRCDFFVVVACHSARTRAWLHPFGPDWGSPGCPGRLGRSCGAARDRTGFGWASPGWGRQWGPVLLRPGAVPAAPGTARESPGHT